MIFIKNVSDTSSLFYSTIYLKPTMYMNFILWRITPLWDRYLLCSISQSCVYHSVKLIKPWTSTVVGMFIVLRPIAVKNSTCKQATKPQTNYCCCLLFSFPIPDWLFPCNTITFQQYFWCSWFWEFHSKSVLTFW